MSLFKSFSSTIIRTKGFHEQSAISMKTFFLRIQPCHESFGIRHFANNQKPTWKDKMSRTKTPLTRSNYKKKFHFLCYFDVCFLFAGILIPIYIFVLFFFMHKFIYLCKSYMTLSGKIILTRVQQKYIPHWYCLS